MFTCPLRRMGIKATGSSRKRIITSYQRLGPKLYLCHCNHVAINSCPSQQWCYLSSFSQVGIRVKGNNNLGRNTSQKRQNFCQTEEAFLRTLLCLFRSHEVKLYRRYKNTFIKFGPILPSLLVASMGQEHTHFFEVKSSKGSSLLMGSEEGLCHFSPEGYGLQP